MDLLSATLTTLIKQCANIKLYSFELFGQAVFAILHKKQKRNNATAQNQPQSCFTFAFTQPHKNLSLQHETDIANILLFADRYLLPVAGIGIGQQ